ncbi:MAG: DUF3494 domain-containing protein [Actinobacteria bacterium]|nr:DUF3494 domain-containing protein [Actinomycetota bacterium]
MTTALPISSTPALRPRRLVAAALVGTVLTFIGTVVGSTSVHAGIVPTVQLATAGNYSVLAATTVSNTNPSVLDQSVGLAPGTSIVGFPPGIVNAPGTIAATGPETLTAQDDLTIAYVDAAGRSVEFTQTNPDLVGQTLIPGVYAATAKAPLSLSGQLVLDGQNNSDAVFIFQTDSTLITSSASSIVLINGASECNIFWQVGSSATLGTGSTFVGNILALTSITVGSAVTVHGRALARNGAVTLDNDTFTQPSCVPTTEVTAPTTTTTVAPTTTLAPTTLAPTTTLIGGVGKTSIAPATSSPVFVPTTPFFPPPFTLPRTGGTGPGGSSALAALVVLIGGAAMVIARRRRPR